MEVLKSYEGISGIRILFYYIIVALAAIYTLRRFGINKLTIFIVLIFWEGMIDYFGRTTFLNFDYYKIFIFIYALLLFGPNILKKRYKTDKLLNITFILFSISFWISFILNEQSFITIASQYGKKIAIPFLFYHGIKDILHNPKKADFLARMLLFIVFLQVGFSVVKVSSIGGFSEGNVGSISHGSGGTAVVLPILGFFLIWLNKKGNLNRKDWLFVLSLMLIAIASMKRSPVFVFPVVVLFTLVYVKQSVRLVSLLKYIPVVIVLLYFGVRTNYTLNPEKSTWGSFNIEYVYNYVMEYSFGSEDISQIKKNPTGRGGSLFVIFSPGSFNFSLSEYLFGKGLEDVVTQSRYERQGMSEYHVLGGVGSRTIYTLGYMGLIFYLLFAFSIIRVINNKRFRIVVLGFFIWEFFLYGNVTLYSNAMAVLLVFICLYHNTIFNNKKQNSHLIYKT